MTSESTLSKRPVLKFTEVLFFLFKLFSPPSYSFPISIALLPVVRHVTPGDEAGKIVWLKFVDFACFLSRSRAKGQRQNEIKKLGNRVYTSKRTFKKNCVVFHETLL